MFEDRIKKEDVEELVNTVMDAIIDDLEKSTPRLVNILTVVIKQSTEQFSKSIEETGAWEEFTEVMKSLQEQYGDHAFEGYR